MGETDAHHDRQPPAPLTATQLKKLRAALAIAEGLGAATVDVSLGELRALLGTQMHCPHDGTGALPAIWYCPKCDEELTGAKGTEIKQRVADEALSRATAAVWEDRNDEWSAEITAAHPSRSGDHTHYGTAMQMVGNRHGKFALVDLVNWLLMRLARDPKAKTRTYYAERREFHSQRDFYMILRPIVGTERVAAPKGSKDELDAADLERSIGIGIKDGDEVEVSVRVVSRLVAERKKL